MNTKEIQSKENLVSQEIPNQGPSDNATSPPSVDALATVYDALMQAFVQQQQMQRSNVQAMSHCVDQQRETNKILDQIHFLTIPDYETTLNQQKENVIDQWKQAAQSGALSIFHIYPGDWDKIENYIRTGSMPPEGDPLHCVMELIRADWSNHDFEREAHAIIEHDSSELAEKNIPITTDRDLYNNQIAMNQQYGQLVSSQTQAELSRMSQTMNSFTSLLSSQKEAVTKVFR